MAGPRLTALVVKALAIVLIARHVLASDVDRPIRGPESAPQPRLLEPQISSTGWKQWLRKWLQRLRKWPQPIVLALIALGFFAGGCWVRPDPDNDSALPGTFALDVPTSQDAAGDNLVKGVQWLEIHDDKVEGIDALKDAFGSEAPLPPLQRGDIRAVVTVFFDRMVKKDVSVELGIVLPIGATLDKFGGAPGAGDVKCGPPPKREIDSGPLQPARTGQDSGLRARGRSGQYLQCEGSPKSPDDFFAFYMDLRGAQTGISFATTRTRVRVQAPQISLRLIGSPHPVTVTTVAAITDADKFSWSGSPVIDGPSEVGWDSDAHPSARGLTGPNTGVKEQVTRDDADKTFLAGVLLGVAGGAVVGFVQALFLMKPSPETA
jgi:hypothetical protein